MANDNYLERNAKLLLSAVTKAGKSGTFLATANRQQVMAIANQEFRELNPSEKEAVLALAISQATGASGASAA